MQKFFILNLEKEIDNPFVFGINCFPKTAIEKMIITKEQFGKTDSIQGFHRFQLFPEGKVTPERDAILKRSKKTDISINSICI